ncbi:MAG: hypothetical protein KBG82_08000 [Spirochaetes bacterium]|nr:hypothetical protein [Spirochaetota bacterium]
MKKKTIYAFIILVFLFFTVACTSNSIKDNKIADLPKSTSSDMSNRFTEAVNLFSMGKYEDSARILISLYVEREKNPLLAEDISIYLFSCLINLTCQSEDRANDVARIFSDLLKTKPSLQDIFDYIYANYTREYNYSSKKNIMLFLRLVDYFVLKDYITYISRYQSLSNDDFKIFDKQQKDFLNYLYAISFLKIENVSKAQSIANAWIEANSAEPLNYFYNLLCFIYIDFSKNLVEYSKYESKMQDPKDDEIIKYSLINPLKKDDIIKAREKIFFIIFHDDPIFQKSSVYTLGSLNSFIFAGSFLDGIYLYDYNRNLIHIIQSSNSNLYSNLIRDFYTFDSHMLICTYEGINSIDLSNIDMKKYNELSFAAKIEYVKSNLSLTRLNIFPYGKKYSCVFEDDKYIVATTHYNGIYIYNKKKKDLTNVLPSLTVEKAIIVNDILYVASYQKGFYILDLNNQKFEMNLMPEVDVKYVFQNEDFIYVITYKDGVYRAKISDNSARNGAFSLLIPRDIVSYAKSAVIIKNNLYIGSLKNGLYIYNLDSGVLKNLNTTSNFFSDSITSCIDYGGYLLISSLNQGIAMYFD